ncbi:Transcriptional activator protein Pur alpha [Trichuris trichiura]|uniref:Transcriptional activator protein Pur alpha n=1 Tax=Trichuris trichiura TaxID=36087 RepID=A0A077Z9C0_TRITR|nr:Transcriptional activator protein Pur alpha [Trichuris trichiura]
MADESPAEGVVRDEEELASRMLQIQSKRFYIDVKQNRRGRFMKIAEVGVGGRKSRVFMSVKAVSEFKKRLINMENYYKEIESEAVEGKKQNGPSSLLKSDVIYQENRRYYLDFKENSRGKFLRVTQTVSRLPGPRSQIAIPAEGMQKLREALDELLDTYGKDIVDSQASLPESIRIRTDNKVFYCDVRQNRRGVFMRISEVRADVRSVISVPEKGWIRFRNYFMDVCEEMAKLHTNGGSENAVEGEASTESAGADSSEAGEHVPVANN